MTLTPPRCPIHHVPLVTFCPACRGTKGGRAVTPKKRASSARNAQKARAVKAQPPGEPERPP